MNRVTAVSCLLLLAGAVAAQEDPEKKVRFQFKDASIDALLEYLSGATPWVFVKTGAVKSGVKITAYSDTEIPLSRVLEFVDTALKPHGLATLRVKDVVAVVGEQEAKDKTLQVRVGNKPEEIELTDQVITQILPLHNVSVVEVQKELKNILEKAGTVAINRHANVIVVSGRSQDVHRLARILSVIDAQVNDSLKVKVIPLTNADAVEMAKTLNEVFRRETAPQEGGGNFLSNMMRMFGGGRGGRREGGGEVQPESVAGQLVRITADERTNSIVLTASEENLKLVEEVVHKLDLEMGQAMKVKMYPLQNADATEVARVVTDLFGTEAETTSSRGGRRGGPPWMPFMAGGEGGEAAARRRDLKAVAETRTNSVVVTAHENDLKIIDELVAELDRQVTDVIKVEIYPLKNSEAADMAQILKDLFRSQIQASQSTARTAQGGGGQGGPFGRMFGFGGGQNPTRTSSLPPSQEVEITADSRTNSVIAKASDQYQEVIRSVIRDLDANPTEAMTTYTIPLRNASAADLATVLRDLLRGTSSSATSTQNRQGSGLPFNPQQTNRAAGETRSRNQAPTRGRTQRLGPLPMQEEPLAPIQEDPQERRSVEGQVDVQADSSTNSLVVRTSPRNFDAIQRLVDDLDRMRPQVLIKVLIAEVTLTGDLQFGVEGFWENGMRVRGGDRATNRLGTDFALATQGFSYLLNGDEFQASLNMFAQDGRLQVLATPRILVLDNQTANINVGREVPIITNSQVTQQGNTINTVQYESVGILLEVTPHVNPDGLVTMAIHPEISDVASQAEAVQITEGVTNPTFLVNSADTTVAVRNGQTVVIGGLIRESSDDTVEKIPLLGDIPILGLLFSNTTKLKVKRELMIFLTPYVAYSAMELEELTELEKSRLKLLDERAIESEGDRWLDRIRD